MIELIALTTYDPPRGGRRFGTYRPLVEDNELFDPSNWFVHVGWAF